MYTGKEKKKFWNIFITLQTIKRNGNLCWYILSYFMYDGQLTQSWFHTLPILILEKLVGRKTPSTGCIVQTMVSWSFHLWLCCNTHDKSLLNYAKQNISCGQCRRLVISSNKIYLKMISISYAKYKTFNFTSHRINNIYTLHKIIFS
jgi:hypothetical protein